MKYTCELCRNFCSALHDLRIDGNDHLVGRIGPCCLQIAAQRVEVLVQRHPERRHDALSIAETEACYRGALKRLRPGDRPLVIAHVEREWTAAQIAKAFGKPSVDAARVAVSRAMQRLVREMQKPRST